MRFIHNHYNNINEPSAKFITRNLLHTIVGTMLCPMSMFKITHSLHLKSTQLKDKQNRMPLNLVLMPGKLCEDVI